MSHQVIDYRDLHPPIISRATQMRNDEIHVRIFFGQQFAHRYRAHDIVYNRQRKLPRGFTHFSTNGRVVAMQLYSDKAEFLDCLTNRFLQASSIMKSIDKSKAKESIRAI